jgi:beta-glucosidase
MISKPMLKFLAVFICIKSFTICYAQSDIDEITDKLIKQMTLEEKINMIHASGTFISGGVQRLGVPELRMSDGPCGIRMEIKRENWDLAGWNNDNGTYFPAQTALAATWDTSLAGKFGYALGQESGIRGKNIQLAPGINIIRTPLCGRNWEYMSEDPFLISSLVVPVIQGLQSNGIAACVKHYALNNQENERGTIDVSVDERPLREIYLPGFEAAIKEANALSIMGAYNKFRGQHATYNEYLVEDILKGEWGFKGPVISDWGACHSTLEAALCGLDIEMGTRASSFDQYFMALPLIKEINRGKVDVRFIDDKVRRILFLMLKINIINGPKFDTTGMYSKLAVPERVAVAKQIAEESIVLLKNDNNFLPLDISNIKTIAVIGDNATRRHSTGGGSTTMKARYEITPLEALRKKLEGKVLINYAKGYDVPEPIWRRGYSPSQSLSSILDSTNEERIKEAVEVAKKSDCVLIFGGLNHNWGNDSEGADKPSMKLPYGQDRLISEILKVNTRTVVILLCGSPVGLGDWYNNVPALLQNSYLGMEGGTALAEVIFGDINPSGKLSMTFPKKLEDSPAHAIGEYPGYWGRVHYKEGLLVGYRYFDTRNVEPLFPFGYGLSYTGFEYENLKLPSEIRMIDKEIIVSFEIKNSGKREGKEIAQVYIRDVESSLERPFKELKGFGKVGLKPGETKRLIIKLDKRAFQFYDPVKMEWVAEPGKFEILIGSSSKDIRLKGEIKLL